VQQIPKEWFAIGCVAGYLMLTEFLFHTRLTGSVPGRVRLQAVRLPLASKGRRLNKVIAGQWRRDVSVDLGRVFQK